MTDKKQREAIEWNILMALFASTNDQMLMLLGVPKQHAKLIFKRWKMEGDKLQNIIESKSSEDHLQEYKDVIQNATHELRKKLNQ